MPTKPTFAEELDLVSQGYALVAGVDEAGRGPLAGPVVAAAVILPDTWLRWKRRSRKPRSRKDQDPREYLRDSKELSSGQLKRLYAAITEVAIAYGVGVCSSETIDRTGIVPATRQAMCDAITALPRQPDALLIDAVDLPEAGLPCRPIINGDALCGSISAGSIIAKVTRDRLMEEMDSRFPGYGFAKHKGYATREHLRQLESLGPSPIHRRTFQPVREMLIQPRLL